MPSTNKQRAVDFLDLVTHGHIDDAYEKYVDMDGVHHNIFTPAGFGALREGMKEAHAKFPHKQFDMQHVLGDEDFVAVHSYLKLNEETQMSVVHLFRFKDQRIIEMWDVGQAIPKELPNEDGPF
jgi:predicted SnoaL-like aldol condensation-catalyzing enzyme